jgi:hypothetical protein
VRLPEHALTDGVLIRGGVETRAMASGLPLRVAGFVMETQTLALTHSPFVPVAIGFFGLGAGYFVWGGQALFDFPKPSPDVNRTMGMWGFWMPGFLQFITGVYLIVGLTWFDVFGSAAPLYMAGLAFTAYGIHWFAMAHRRYIGSSSAPDAWIAIAFLFLSVLGAYVFFRAGDTTVMLIFVGLTLIYLVEIPTRFLSWATGGRVVGLLQLATAIWLMYCTYSTVIRLAVDGKA